MSLLLDTNVISELRKSDRMHPAVAEWARHVDPADMGTSVLVLAEIRRGIELKRLRDPLQAEALDRWFAKMRARLDPNVFGIDEPIAAEWARMNVPDPLPLVDSLLAATAKIRGLTLATRNVRDLARTGVALVNPFGD